MSLGLPPASGRISRLRYDALAGYSRMPSAEFYAHELSWYEHKRAPILGVVILDITDQDFGGIIMGRDEGRRMRCVDVVGWDDSPEGAEIRLIASLEDWAKRSPSEM